VACFRVPVGVCMPLCMPQVGLTIECVVACLHLCASAFVVPQVGLIIGRGGETIKGLQSRSGARIQVGGHCQGQQEDRGWVVVSVRERRGGGGKRKRETEM